MAPGFLLRCAGISKPTKASKTQKSSHDRDFSVVDPSMPNQFSIEANRREMLVASR